jgi:hypothetical protein
MQDGASDRTEGTGMIRKRTSFLSAAVRGLIVASQKAHP